VDAVIRLQAGLVPVDAKFPLENFQRLVKAETPEEKKVLRRAFITDVKKHIEAIATKYIRTDEGTFDFALMYVPAENVYYETIIKDDELGADGALFAHALARRVIPVSPNSFYAYLQTILLGLKGLRVEESAREIINHLARLNQEFDRFSESFRLVGRPPGERAQEIRGGAEAPAQGGRQDGAAGWAGETRVHPRPKSSNPCKSALGRVPTPGLFRHHPRAMLPLAPAPFTP
jgi:DNA anti-recombination protein RmuC